MSGKVRGGGGGREAGGGSEGGEREVIMHRVEEAVRDDDKCEWAREGVSGASWLIPSGLCGRAGAGGVGGEGLSGWALVRVGMLMGCKWRDVVSGGGCCVVRAFGVACWYWWWWW